jgi:hypothetical protein
MPLVAGCCYRVQHHQRRLPRAGHHETKYRLLIVLRN